MLKFLLERGLDPDAGGVRSIEAAIWSGNPNFASFITQYNAGLISPLECGEVPLVKARRYNLTEIEKMIESVIISKEASAVNCYQDEIESLLEEGQTVSPKPLVPL
ncbi:MAG: hypothetical protein IBX55_00745 [Methyloprofundus sp.]|nr:hypothetical protein [Methyloprofundus sp.]